MWQLTTGLQLAVFDLCHTFVFLLFDICTIHVPLPCNHTHTKCGAWGLGKFQACVPIITHGRLQGGVETTEWIRAYEARRRSTSDGAQMRSTPIVGLTGSVHPDDLALCIAGAFAALVAPTALQLNC